MTADHTPQLKPPGRPPRKESGQTSLKERIMDITMDVLGANGLSGTSLKKISQRAGVTPALIHYYFGSRKSLLETALAQRFVPLAFSFWAPVEVSDQPLEVLEEMARRIVKAALENSWFVPLWSRELASENGRLREYMRRRLNRATLIKFAALIKRGQDEGLINRALTPELVFLSLAANILLPLSGRETWGRLYGTDLDLIRTIRHATAMFQNGLKPVDGNSRQFSNPVVLQSNASKAIT